MSVVLSGRIPDDWIETSGALPLKCSGRLCFLNVELTGKGNGSELKGLSFSFRDSFGLKACRSFLQVKPAGLPPDCPQTFNNRKRSLKFTRTTLSFLTFLSCGETRISR